MLLIFARIVGLLKCIVRCVFFSCSLTPLFVWCRTAGHGDSRQHSVDSVDVVQSYHDFAEFLICFLLKALRVCLVCLLLSIFIAN